jgi:hypothetical protein
MYKQEFKLHWQPLMEASVGLGLGSALSHYTMSLFGPPLIAEFLSIADDADHRAIARGGHRWSCARR